MKKVRNIGNITFLWKIGRFFVAFLDQMEKSRHKMRFRRGSLPLFLHAWYKYIIQLMTSPVVRVIISCHNISHATTIHHVFVSIFEWNTWKVLFKINYELRKADSDRHGILGQSRKINKVLGWQKCNLLSSTVEFAYSPQQHHKPPTRDVHCRM